MEPADAHAVGLKLPVFWADHPRVWLQQAEAQFAVRNVTADNTKYHYVVAALDQATVLRVIDVLEDPPQHNKYDNLKRRPTDIFGLSRRQRADQLLDIGLHSLGDRRPSQLMDEMLALLGSHKPCMLFESIFLRCMPEDIRLQLAMSRRSSTHGLVINVSKCQFGATTIDYLGHQITSQGAIPLPAKVEAIRTFARPTTIKGLQQFVGMLNFYHRFIPNAAHIMRLIYDTLAGKPMTLKWSDELDEAFTTAKEALAQATMLVHPHADKPTALTVDASGTAVGAVLEKISDGSDWKPVAFFSRKLRPAEQHYSAFDRELLAAYLAIRHFRYFPEGCSFTLFTDHKPLTFGISKISDPWSPRQQRHLAYVSEFTTDVRHIEGKANTVADTLSRGEISAISSSQPGVDYKAMAAACRREYHSRPDSHHWTCHPGHTAGQLRQLGPRHVAPHRV